MKLKYFKNCNNIEDIKKQYKNLAFEHHPDKGGCTEIMKQINIEYEYLIKNFKVNPEINEINDLEKFRDKLEILINLENILIELIGNWLWIGGETKPHKETLKNNGFFWAKNKEKWFYRTEQDKTVNKGKTMTMDEIRTKYGSKIIGKNFKHLNN